MKRRSIFDTLVREYTGAVLSTARMCGLPWHEAQDVVQDVFLALFCTAKAGRLDLDRVAAWLHTVTCRKAWARRDELRRQGTLSPIEGSALEPKEEGLRDTGRRVAVGDEWSLLLELLEEVTPDNRLVFMLHEIRELTHEEIAGALELPLGTVASRHREGRAEFEEAQRRHRAKERRTTRGVVFILLPLGTLLQYVRRFPPPEIPASAQAEVWARVQERITAGSGVGDWPRTPGRVAVSRARLAFAGAAIFTVGAVSGVVGNNAFHRVPPPIVTTSAPILAVAPGGAEDAYVPAVLPTVLADAPTTPPEKVTRTADPPETESEAECLQKARVKLSLDPRGALRMVEQCARRFPRHLFPEAYEQIRFDAQQALAPSRQKL